MLTNEVNFKKLSVFLMFMQERNISRAAERLNMSAVSVHRALHSLEDAVGFPLFVNKGRNLIPLESAELLVQPARQSINSLQAGLSTAREATGEQRKTLRLGLLCSLIPDVLPRLLEGLHARKPGLNVEIISGPNSLLIQQLNETGVDAALVGTPYLNAGKPRNVPLFNDELYFGCPTSSRHASLKAVDVADFAEESFISLSSGFSTALMYDEVFRIADFTPHTIATAHDIFSLVHFVAQGIGYTLLPKRMSTICRTYGVTLVPLVKKYGVSQDIVLIYKPSREKNQNLLVLAAECRAFAATARQPEKKSGK